MDFISSSLGGGDSLSKKASKGSQQQGQTGQLLDLLMDKDKKSTSEKAAGWLTMLADSGKDVKQKRQQRLSMLNPSSSNTSDNPFSF